MTPFILLSLAMGLLAGAWLTHPLWRTHLQGTTPLRASSAWAPGANHRSLVVPAALTLAILVVAGGGWTWLGAADGLRVGPGATLAAPTAKRAMVSAPARNEAPAEAESRMAAMADRLAERLKKDPDDADGWHMLGRSYAALGKHGQAIGAFRSAARLRPDDAALLTEWAFSAAVINQRGSEDEPAQLVERALRLAPKDAKALALAGTLALDRRDYAAAVDYWEQLARVEPTDSAIGKKIQASIEQVRQLAATRAAPIPISARTFGMPLAAAGNDLGGTVTLAAALRERVSPDDTVFVYARSAAGPRMPLAVLRKQVKDLPLRFTLDDSLAMSPAARLTGASSVIVGARIAKSGNAVAQQGDLQGQSLPVAVGSRDLKIEINEVVQAR